MSLTPHGVGQEDPEGAEDVFDLTRFTAAQEGVYERALSELRAGRKRTHWMWFIFPQITGLGYSDMSKRYAIQGIGEARAYLAHPILGARLRECAAAILAAEERTATEIFGSPDDLKLRSSMTLFAQASDPDSVFLRVLEKFFGGEQDAETVRRLNQPVARS